MILLTFYYARGTYIIEHNQNNAKCHMFTNLVRKRKTLLSMLILGVMWLHLVVCKG